MSVHPSSVSTPPHLPLSHPPVGPPSSMSTPSISGSSPTLSSHASSASSSHNYRFLLPEDMKVEDIARLRSIFNDLEVLKLLPPIEIDPKKGKKKKLKKKERLAREQEEAAFKKACTKVITGMSSSFSRARRSF